MREIKLNGFNNGRDTTDGVGGGNSLGEHMEELAFLNKVETSVKVLRTMLRVSNLKLGVESANELLKQIQIKMNKELFKRIREIFEEKISKKTGWGKNELMIEYDKAVNEALMELLNK